MLTIEARTMSGVNNIACPTRRFVSKRRLAFKLAFESPIEVTEIAVFARQLYAIDANGDALLSGFARQPLSSGLYICFIIFLLVLPLISSLRFRRGNLSWLRMRTQLPWPQTYLEAGWRRRQNQVDNSHMWAHDTRTRMTAQSLPELLTANPRIQPSFPKR